MRVTASTLLAALVLLSTTRGAAALAPAGFVAVTTTPVGATVEIDGRELCTSPCLEPVPAGAHRLSVKLVEHRSVEEPIDVRPNETLTKQYRLVSSIGIVEITVPSAMTVHVLPDPSKDGSFQPPLRMDGIDTAPTSTDEFGYTSVDPGNSETGWHADLVPKSPERFHVGSGRWIVAFQSSDRRTEFSRVVVEAGKTVRVRAPILASLVGRIEVRSTRAVTAKLEDEYEAPGDAADPASEADPESESVHMVQPGHPVVFENVREGSRVLKFSAPGVRSAVLGVVVTAAKTAVVEAPVLVSALGSLVVNSIPAGASVRMDSGPAGITPFAFANVLEGAHTLTVGLPGMKPQKRKVTVIAGQRTSEEVRFDLASLEKLEIRSSPSSLNVVLDEVAWGRTPLVLYVDPGPHELRIGELPAAQPYEECVDAKAGRERLIDAAVELRVGQVAVITDPLAADVFVDGAHRGRSPSAVADLPAGPHAVEARRSGFATACQLVEVEAGETTTIRWKLQPIVSQPPSKNRPWRGSSRDGTEAGRVLGQGPDGERLPCPRVEPAPGIGPLVDGHWHGEERSAPVKRGAPVVDVHKREEDRRKIMESGLIALLGGDTAGETSNILGPGGVAPCALGGIGCCEPKEWDTTGPMKICRVHHRAEAGCVVGQGDANGVGGMGARGGGGTGLGSRSPGELDAAGTGKSGTKFIPGKTSIVGDLSAEAVDGVVRRHWNELKSCYEKELNKDPNLAGKVAMSFVIGSTGDVSEARVAETSLNNAPAEACMVQNALRWKFPVPRDGRVEVTYPFIFQSQ